MYTLYGFPTVHTKKVLYVLEELELNYDYKKVDLFKREQQTPDFLNKNPIGKVPVLGIDGDHLFESGAICRYLANVVCSSLYSEDKLLRAKTDQWIDFFTGHIGRWFAGLFYERVLKPGANLGPINEAAVEESIKFIDVQGAKVETWLESNEYFLGRELSIADFYAFAYIELHEPTKFSIDKFPNLKRWYENIKKRPSIVAGKKVLDS